MQAGSIFSIGGYKDLKNSCNIEFSISDIKIFDRPLEDYEIQASAGSPFGIVPPSYFHLACHDCSFDEAQRNCVEGYSLCDEVDLYGGVWQAAYTMG